MRRTEYIDIEHRGFPINDVGFTNDSLLAAMVADERIADAWENNTFRGMFSDEAMERQVELWHESKRDSLAYLNRRLWAHNIERNRS